MKFTDQAGRLVRALSLVSGGVSRKSTLPVLEHVLLSVDGVDLHITATDLEKEWKLRHPLEPGSAADVGAVCAPYARLMALLKSLPADASVRFALDGDKLTLASGRSRFRLATLPAEQFPAFPAGELGEPFEVPADGLAGLIASTSYAMAQNDVRYYLNGLSLQRAENGLVSIGSDGHRMAVAEWPVAVPGAPAEWIVNRNCVGDLVKLLGQRKGDEAITVQAGPNTLRFAGWDTVLSVRLIEGKYPDWRRVVPTETPHVIRVDRDMLVSAIRRVCVTADGAATLKIEHNSGLLTLSASDNSDSASDEVSCEYEGRPEWTVCASGKYLDAALSACPEDTVRLAMSDNLNSIKITDDSSAVHIVMPMRM